MLHSVEIDNASIGHIECYPFLFHDYLGEPTLFQNALGQLVRIRFRTTDNYFRDVVTIQLILPLTQSRAKLN